MEMNSTYSVIAIDDHPLFRKGVVDLIGMDESGTLVGEAATGRDGVRLAKELHPDLVLLDINMKGQDGLTTLREIKEMDLDLRVLMLTVSDSEEDVVEALRSGADGYLLKDMEPEDTLEAIHQVLSGNLVLSEQMRHLLSVALSADNEVPRTINSVDLTRREQQILRLIAKGMSNKLIARELEISVGTVKVHVKNLLKKLHLNSRVEAAVWALKRDNSRNYTGMNQHNLDD